MKTSILILLAAAAVACAPKSQPKPATPAAGGATLAAATGQIAGTVTDSMDAAGYTYLKLKTDRGDVWAAVRQTPVKVGAKAVVNGQMTLDNFESKTLKRTFDHIVFGTIDDGSAPPAGMASAMGNPAAGGSPHGMMEPQPKIDLKNIKVDKASGPDAKTIAELYAATSVNDAPVTVRGKVVKFLPSIMGKNWMHLRDGSGSDAKHDNDITVTTADTVAVGDVVVVKGTVRRDKDFGAGYNYPVLIEDGKVSK